MKVFLVRHGVTQDATDKKGQSPESPLSEEGLRQAKAVAKRLSREDVDIILSSKWKRAHQTAEIIAAELNKKVELFEGIHEKERGEVFYGSSYDSDIHKEHDIEVQKNWGDLDWKFRGEGESVRDVLQRATKLRDHLIENHTNQNVLIVSHSGFIRSFVSTAILGDNYSETDVIKLWSALRVSNTGITLMEYGMGDWNRWIPWDLIYFNDRLHL